LWFFRFEPEVCRRLWRIKASEGGVIATKIITITIHPPAIIAAINTFVDAIIALIYVAVSLTVRFAVLTVCFLPVYIALLASFLFLPYSLANLSTLALRLIYALSTV